MPITDSQKEEITNKVLEGKEDEAITYLQKTFGIRRVEAKMLVHKIKRENGVDNFDKFMNKGRNLGKLVGGFFMVLGLIFLGLAVGFVISDLNFERKAIPVIGHVVDNPYQPLFEYEFDGEIYSWRSSTYSDSPSYYVGEEIEILVNPEAPHDILVNTFTERYVLVLIFGVMGTFMAGMGGAAFFLFRKL